VLRALKVLQELREVPVILEPLVVQVVMVVLVL
jgi:hypothetical protein